VVSASLVYQGRVVSLRVDEITLPDGRLATREVVEHPGAVVVAAIEASGDVVLVRQYRHPLRDYLLELPAGGLEAGEDPADAAKRELREEVGLVPIIGLLWATSTPRQGSRTSDWTRSSRPVFTRWTPTRRR